MAISTIKDPELRLQARRALIYDAPLDDDPEGLLRELDRCRSVSDGSAAVRLRRLIPRLPPPLLNSAFDAVYNLKNPDERITVLAELLPRMTPDQATEAFSLAVQLGHDQSQLLGICASQLPGSFLRKIASTGLTITDQKESVYALTAIYRAAADRVELVTPADRFAPRKDIFAELERPPTLLLVQAASWWYVKYGDENTAAEIAHALRDVARWWP